MGGIQLFRAGWQGSVISADTTIRWHSTWKHETRIKNLHLDFAMKEVYCFRWLLRGSTISTFYFSVKSYLVFWPLTEIDRLSLYSIFELLWSLTDYLFGAFLNGNDHWPINFLVVLWYDMRTIWNKVMWHRNMNDSCIYKHSDRKLEVGLRCDKVKTRFSKFEQDHQSLEVVWAPCIKIAHLRWMVSNDFVLLSKLIH